MNEKVSIIYQNGVKYDIQDEPLTNEVEKLKEKVDTVKDSANSAISKANTATNVANSKLDETRADEKYQLKGNYLTEHQSLIDYAKKSEIPTKTSQLENDSGYLTKHQSLDEYALKTEIPTVPTKVSELENDSKFVKEEELESEIYYIHFNMANAKACEDAYNADSTADLSGYDIFTENEADIITKLKENRDLHAILIDEDGNHYQLYSTEITKKGKFKVKFTAPISSKKMIKVEFSTIANDFTSFDKTAIDIGDNELLAIKYLYNYDVDDANKVYKDTDPVIYPSQYLYRKDEIDAKGFLTQHQSLDAYALKTEIPSLSGYATEAWVDGKNYLTEHQTLKTINGESILGEGNIIVAAESGVKIDDTKVTTNSTYSSNKIDNTFLKIPATSTHLTLKQGVFIDGSVAEVYINDTGIVYNNKKDSGSINIVPEYTGGDGSVSGSISVNGFELARKVDLNSYAKLENIPIIPESLPASDVYAWAKEENKPSYTASEVGAYSKTEIDNKGFLTSSSLSDYAKTSAIPTTLPASDVYDWAKAENKPSYTASEVGAYSKTEIDNKGFLTNESLASYAKTSELPTKISELSNDSGYLTSQSLNGYALKTEIPTVPTKVSQLTNDSKYLVAADISGKLDSSVAANTYQTKGEYLTQTSLANYATTEYVNNKVASVYKYRGSVANRDALPTIDLTIGDVYNLEDSGMNVAYTGDSWDELGSTVNLEGYAKTANVQEKLVSGTNIKTINGESILGNGNIDTTNAGNTFNITEVTNVNNVTTSLEIDLLKDIDISKFSFLLIETIVINNADKVSTFSGLIPLTTLLTFTNKILTGTNSKIISCGISSNTVNLKFIGSVDSSTNKLLTAKFEVLNVNSVSRLNIYGVN